MGPLETPLISIFKMKPCKINTLENTTKQVLSFLYKNVQTWGVYMVMGEKGVDEALNHIFTRRLNNTKRD